VLRHSGRDLAVAAAVLGWIGAVLLADAVPGLRHVEAARQLVLGLSTWAVLVVLLRRESPLVRTQTLVVVALATIVEYTFSPLLEAYTYRIGTVPLFVPPGHGLVYLAALALGRSALLRAAPRLVTAATAVLGGAWALAGLLDPGRPDVLGAFWFACLLGFLAWGRSRLLYVGAFVVVSYLEIVGTALGTWAWAPVDPVLGIVSQGNPPSGAAGGYGWFDLYALLLAPWLLAAWTRATAAVGARRGSAGKDLEHLVVQLAVGGQGAAAEGPVGAVQRGEPAPGLDDHRHQRGHVVQLQGGLRGDVHAALGEEHVGPEVPVGPAAPDPALQLQEGLAPPGVAPPAERGVGQGRVAQRGDR
jgi:FtsH-binding integral membrane protein